jgi:hypothetical protein
VTLSSDSDSDSEHIDPSTSTIASFEYGSHKDPPNLAQTAPSSRLRVVPALFGLGLLALVGLFLIWLPGSQHPDPDEEKPSSEGMDGLLSTTGETTPSKTHQSRNRNGSDQGPSPGKEGSDVDTIALHPIRFVCLILFVID